MPHTTPTKAEYHLMDKLVLPRQKQEKHFLDTYFFKKIHSLRASDAFLIRVALLSSFMFLLIFLAQFSTESMVQIPTDGGTYSEGIVGTPRFINPVLAVTRADKDLVALIYDGLMRLHTDGKLIPNVAESITVSEDGLTYNIILRKDIHFQDGVSLTARDVAFTIERIQNPLFTSPLRPNFEGVIVEEIGEYEINFVLPEAYTPFIENLTFGILPEHIWKEADTDEFAFSQYNSEPIGSGQYTVKEIKRNTSGIPEVYTLSAYEEYHLGKPKINTLRLSFYSTKEKLVKAFTEGSIESVAGIEAELIPDFSFSAETHHIETIPLPRTFGLFINQNKSPALRDVGARQALSISINREELVTKVLGGYGHALTSPIPPGFSTLVTNNVTFEPSIDTAREVLRDSGWKMNDETGLWEKNIDGSVTPLRFSISTSNNSTFDTTAEYLRTIWTSLGAEVTVKQFEQSDLTQTIIRPREYETLLFGTDLGRSLDYYSFWHSSQRNDPGLNIALYANITTDSILSEMRRNSEHSAWDEALQKFVTEIDTETPAIFLYSPELLYIVPNRVHGMQFNGVSEPQERFSNLYEWYVQTESIWPFVRE